MNQVLTVDGVTFQLEQTEDGPAYMARVDPADIAVSEERGRWIWRLETPGRYLAAAAAVETPERAAKEALIVFRNQFVQAAK
jgi:hypothetical protein